MTPCEIRQGDALELLRTSESLRRDLGVSAKEAFCRLADAGLTMGASMRAMGEIISLAKATLCVCRRRRPLRASKGWRWHVRRMKAKGEWRP